MRRLPAVILTILGTVLLVAGLVAGHVSRHVLDPDTFAGHVQQIRKSDEVSAAAGRVVTARIIRANPDLVAVRPLLEGVATAVIRSDRLDEPTRRAAIVTVRSLTEADPDGIRLELPGTTAVVVNALQRVVPSVVPPEVDPTLTLVVAPPSTVAAISQTTRRVRLASWLFPLLAVTCYALAIAMASDRRVAITRVGRTMLLGAVALGAALIVGWFTIRGLDQDLVGRATIRAIWRTVVTPLWWSVLALAAVAVGLVKVTGAPLVPRIPIVTDGVHWMTRRNPVATVAFGAAAVALGFALFAGSGTGVSPTTAPGTVCNGHAALCDRPFDEVAYAATHNAMSVASEPGWFIPEQSDPIPTQLDQGVRALLVDVWPGRVSGDTVITAPDRRRLARQIVERDFGATALDALAGLSNQRAGTPTGPTSLFLCHGLCEIGSEPFDRMLTSLHAWLVANPDEVVTVFIEDHAPADQIARAIRDADLEGMVATPPVPGGDWPTLGDMIRSGRRLVVMVENGTPPADAPWLVNGFTLTQDTPYTFRTVADFSCAPNRGPTDASLFLVNHWLAGATSLVSNAEKVNARDVLGARMQTCRAERGQIPNFVAVNFVDLGDTFDVVDELNGAD